MFKKRTPLFLFLIIYFLVAASFAAPCFADSTGDGRVAGESEGIRLIEVRETGGYGYRYKYVDENGADLTPAVFDIAETFENGKALVRQDDQYKLIDREGNTIVTFSSDEYDNVRKITGQDVFLAVKEAEAPEGGWPPFGYFLRSDERTYGFLNPDGTLKTPMVYKGLSRIGTIGKINAALKIGEKYGLISSDGTELTAFIYDGAYITGKGLIMLRLDDKYAFADEEGKFLSDFIYGYVRFDGESSLGALELDGKLAVINEEGQILSGFIYDDVRFFGESLGSVKIDEKYAVINNEGKLLSGFIYDEVGFGDGFGVGDLAEHVAIIDAYGRSAVEDYVTKEEFGAIADGEGSTLRRNLEEAGLVAKRINVYVKRIKNGLQVPTALHKKSTMVPVRVLAEPVKYQVGWDQESKTVTLSDAETVVSFSINNSTAFITDRSGKSASKKVEMEAPAVIIDGQAFVPLNFLADCFDLTVRWQDNPVSLLIDR